MKTTKGFSIVALVAFHLCLPGLRAAENKQPAPTNSAPVSTEKETEYRFKWNVDTLVGDYEKHGRHNPKWDQSAKTALHVFAEVRAVSGSTNTAEPLAK